MKTNVFITTSIPYVNAVPHVGHAQEFVIADGLARLYRAQGKKVVLQSGTDENAFKNVLSAHRAGVSPEEFVTRNSGKFRDLLEKLNVHVDSFIRTTENRHSQGVKKFWTLLNPKDIYTKSYTGHYCIGCEDFVDLKDFENGVCPDHKSAPDFVEEENIFFRLSGYQARIEQLIESDQIKIRPQVRKNEVLSFIRSGLRDISLTRAADRSEGWGIRVPGSSEQVIYVWIDALINYLTGQGFGVDENWQQTWNEQTNKIHVIGKNVWKFHAVYWPALLLSAGLPLPNEILIHGFLTVDGHKISKSLGNAIDPIAVLDEYGSDPLRHYLLSCLSLYGDSDFVIERLSQSYENDLANRLGNLNSRLLTLCKKANFDLKSIRFQQNATVIDCGFQSLQSNSVWAWQRIDEINYAINKHRPWDLLKHDGQSDELFGLLEDWCLSLFAVAELLSPVIPDGALKIKVALLNGETEPRQVFPSRSKKVERV